MRAAVVHLSDLHFCSLLTNAGARRSSWLQADPHDFVLLLALDACFHEIPSHIQDKYQLAAQPGIDAVLATGDITTIAAPIAFEEANNFLRGSKYIRLTGPRVGLEMGSNVFVVPGNHDNWFTRFGLLPRSTSAAYNIYMPTCPYYEARAFANADFAFIGLDSNKGLTGLRNISRGRVDDVDMRWIADRLDTHRKGKKVFAIVMLHHHPALPNTMDEQHLTKLVNAPEVVNGLKAMKADMVVFGHRHESFELSLPTATGSLLLSCAGSACQLGQRQERSFKLYLFFDHSIDIVKYEYNWETRRFAPSHRAEFPYPNGTPF